MLLLTLNRFTYPYNKTAVTLTRRDPVLECSRAACVTMERQSTDYVCMCVCVCIGMCVC